MGSTQHVNLFKYYGALASPATSLRNPTGRDPNNTKPAGYGGIKVVTWAQVCDAIAVGKKVRFDVGITISGGSFRGDNWTSLVTKFYFDHTVVPVASGAWKWYRFVSVFSGLNPDEPCPFMLYCERRNDEADQSITDLGILKHRVDFFVGG